MKRLIWISGSFLLFACASPTPSGGSVARDEGGLYFCSRGNPPTPCEELNISGDQVTATAASCEATGGVWSPGVCLAGASVGRCVLSRAGGGTRSTVYYDRAAAASLHAACDASGGAWGPY